MALETVSQIGIAKAYGKFDTGPGCRLGKRAWPDFIQQESSLLNRSILMAMTKGTFGSQTFGISFGTSGCGRSCGSIIVLYRFALIPGTYVFFCKQL